MAIEKAGSDTRPTDHLSFYCLGKREGAEDLECVLDQLEQPEPGSGAELVRQSLRHPVYVHSKLMVVDDDYIVVGSANINQRSLAGERDTEICVSASQPALSRVSEHLNMSLMWPNLLPSFLSARPHPHVPAGAVVRPPGRLQRPV